MNKKIYAIIETLLVGVLVFVLTVTNALSALDYIARDGIYQVPRGIDSNIKIIGIDEKTMDQNFFINFVNGNMLPPLDFHDVNTDDHYDAGDEGSHPEAQGSGNQRQCQGHGRRQPDIHEIR